MKSALVLSPFATFPTDAGQRRRARQTTALLKKLGFRITFLLYAFEGPWYYGSDIKSLERMLEEWDEVIHFPSDSNVGCNAASGNFHELDEWWSPDLETYIRRLLTRRYFDVMCVHNVWLSKAFSLAAPSTTTILETHDLFFLRNKFYNDGLLKPEFYVIDKDAELQGIQRADIALTIQEEEFEILRSENPSCNVLNVPYVPLADEIKRSNVRRYKKSDTVIFGFIGSAHGFNIAGLNSLMDALSSKIGETFAPVEIIVAGKVSSHIKDILACHRIGYIESEDEFYDMIDFSLAPVFQGTGFKIKVADSIFRGIPILSSVHAAAGTSLPDKYKFDTPEEMASAICSISLMRPALSAINTDLSHVAEEMVLEESESADALYDLIYNNRPNILFNISECIIERDAVKILFWFNLLPTLNNRRLTVIMTEEQLSIFAGLDARYVCVLPNDDRIDAIKSGVVIDPSHGPSILGSWYNLEDESPAISPSSPFSLIFPGSQWSPMHEAIRKRLSELMSEFNDVLHFVVSSSEADRDYDFHNKSVRYINTNSRIFDNLLAFIVFTMRDDIKISIHASDMNERIQSLLDVCMERRFQLVGSVGGAKIHSEYSENIYSEFRKRCLLAAATVSRLVLTWPHRDSVL